MATVAVVDGVARQPSLLPYIGTDSQATLVFLWYTIKFIRTSVMAIVVDCIW